ncbi:kinase-like domain-containing protein [Mycena pura]|uniref:non-specific serine/threonine protein kinase n=1 Tax=Mycena pura TaxID=153505 RepID=A0AAD6VRI8_9AGAR|nr:kinase-like domain-containing protein [Mycena pura]
MVYQEPNEELREQGLLRMQSLDETLRDLKSKSKLPMSSFVIKNKISRAIADLSDVRRDFMKESARRREELELALLEDSNFRAPTNHFNDTTSSLDNLGFQIVEAIFDDEEEEIPEVYKNLKRSKPANRIFWTKVVDTISAPSWTVPEESEDAIKNLEEKDQMYTLVPGSDGELGEGNYGSVGLAKVKDPNGSKPFYVAVKRFQDDQFIEREFSAFHFGLNLGEGTRPSVIVLEYVSGISVENLIALLALDENQCKGVIKQVASGLRHLHLLKIIHRDLKGSNVLIRETGVIKLVDFGISKLTSDLPVTHSQATVSGTDGFIAPEIIRQTGQYTELSDVWSLGCLILEILCRDWPQPKYIDWESRVMADSDSKLPFFMDTVPSEVRDKMSEKLVYLLSEHVFVEAETRWSANQIQNGTWLLG